jgi:hypothetical protein
MNLSPSQGPSRRSPWTHFPHNIWSSHHLTFIFCQPISLILTIQLDYCDWWSNFLPLGGCVKFWGVWPYFGQTAPAALIKRESPIGGKRREATKQQLPLKERWFEKDVRLWKDYIWWLKSLKISRNPNSRMIQITLRTTKFDFHKSVRHDETTPKSKSQAKTAHKLVVNSWISWNP